MTKYSEILQDRLATIYAKETLAMMVTNGANGRPNVKSKLWHFPRFYILPIPPRYEIGRQLDTSKLYPEIAYCISKQRQLEDNYPETRPLLLYDAERVRIMHKDDDPSSSVVQMKLLVDSLVQTPHHNRLVYRRAAIRGTTDDDNFMIVYSNNCNTLGKDVSDIERNYILTRTAGELGLSPKAYWLSPPVKLPTGWIGPKTDFHMSLKQYMDCSRDSRSTVRYMLLQRVPFTAWQQIGGVTQLDSRSDKYLFLKKGRSPDSYLGKLKVGVEMAIAIMQKLTILHSRHFIVHGNVVPKTIARYEQKGELVYGLWDFEFGFYNAEFEDGTYYETVDRLPLGRKDGEENFCFNSHWNLGLVHGPDEEGGKKKGTRIGYRDDVLNTLLIASMMTHGLALYNFCQSLSRSDLRKWKASGNLFEPWSPSITFGAEEEKMRPLIEGPLFDTLTIVRSAESVNTIPDHDAIIKILQEVRDALN